MTSNLLTSYIVSTLPEPSLYEDTPPSHWVSHQTESNGMLASFLEEDTYADFTGKRNW